jgi:hypothetical protein
MHRTQWRRRAVLASIGAVLGLVGLAPAASAAEWVAGHYGPGGHWIPGHWIGHGPYPVRAPEDVAPPHGYRPGRVWIPGHYERGVWVRGHWAAD